MRNFIREVFNWVFDIDGKRSEDVIEVSITGEELVKVRLGGRGIRVYRTDVGKEGTKIMMKITQFGSDTELMKKVVAGDCDNVLSARDKETVIKRIRQRADEGGRYVRTVYNNKGTLDFVYDYWHYGDLKDIRELLNKHYGEPDSDPVPDLPR